MFKMHVSNNKTCLENGKKLCNLNNRIKMKKINLDMHKVTEDSALCDPFHSPALHRTCKIFNSSFHYSYRELPYVYDQAGLCNFIGK